MAPAPLAAVTSAVAAASVVPRLRLRFDDDWRFRLEPPPAPVTAEATITAWQAEAISLNEAGAPARLAADAAEPDAAIAGGAWQPVSVGDDLFHGRVGFALFRADLPPSLVAPRGQCRILRFDSVDDNATVLLNGRLLTHHEGWNQPFDVDLTGAWHEGGPNRLVVLVENTAGAGGIRGPVTLGLAAAPADFANPAVDDSGWRHVHLPHDYVVEGVPTPTADLSHGFLPVQSAWYRKSFVAATAWAGRRVWIDFDGVYRDSTVTLNGHRIGNWPSGYTPIRYDLTPYLRYGGRNVLAVHVDPTQFEGWFYEGGGIYRHVWLNVAGPVHVAPYGAIVRSAVHPPTPGASGASTAALTLLTDVVNESAHPASAALDSTILDPSGRLVADIRTPVIRALAPGERVTVTQSANVIRPQLWGLASPRLYMLHTRVLVAGRTTDAVETPFGIRTVRFDPDHGLFLNGVPIKIQGTCNHQDYPGVGVGMPDGLQAWRLRVLKDMGANAIRCSHNPPSAELLDACDRLGILVMDENRHLGGTESPKSSQNTPIGDLAELRTLIERDRNHPSVILWSLCNEEGIQGSPHGGEIFAAMKAVVRSLDPTRPVTAAMNGGWESGLGPISDAIGMNYNTWAYDRIHARFPTIPIYASETASTVSTRGIYANDRERGYVSAYDVNVPPWADTAEDAWRQVASRPWMAGAFVWTGFDYKGEPTPYGWPCINSHFGIVDICGFPKDNYYWYRAWWAAAPLVHVLPHWTWPGHEGQPITVWVYGNTDRVELLLNGRSLGTKPMPRYGHAEWQVPYAPGRLEARGATNGRLMAADVEETVGPPAAIRLVAMDRTRLLADAEDCVPIAAQIVDSHGRIVPTADNPVVFTIRGVATIAGVGNGDPSDHEPDDGSRRRAFNGLCMAVIRAGDEPGTISVQASAPGLKTAVIRLAADAAQPALR